MRAPFGRWAAVAVVVAALAAAAEPAIAAPAVAPTAAAGATAPQRIAARVSVAGVPVGGLTARGARVRLTKRLGRAARRVVVVRVAGRRARFAPLTLGARLDVGELAERALAAGRRAKGRAVDLRVGLRAGRGRVLAAVNRLARAVRRPARSARLSIGLSRVRARGGRYGRALARPLALGRKVRALVADPLGPRNVRWRTTRVRPTLSIPALGRRVGSVVTVSRARKLARLFTPTRRGRWRRARAYRVAVGRPGFPTPTGRFAVFTKQVNPSWTAPSWAGPVAGRTIPGGSGANPIKARWIGFTGSVGFHGTADLSSLGSEASHGCVRMSVPGVISLYRKVRIGTPVLVR
jgi:L,D-transpeptidase-like protein